MRVGLVSPEQHSTAFGTMYPEQNVSSAMQAEIYFPLDLKRAGDYLKNFKLCYHRASAASSSSLFCGGLSSLKSNMHIQMLAYGTGLNNRCPFGSPVGKG